MCSGAMSAKKAAQKTDEALKAWVRLGSCKEKEEKEEEEEE